MLLLEAALAEMLAGDALADALETEEPNAEEADAVRDPVELGAEDVLAATNETDALTVCEATEDWIALRMLDGIHVVSELEYPEKALPNT